MNTLVKVAARNLRATSAAHRAFPSSFGTFAATWQAFTSSTSSFILVAVLVMISRLLLLRSSTKSSMPASTSHLTMPTLIVPAFLHQQMYRLLRRKPSHWRRRWPHFRNTRQLKQDPSEPSHRPIWFVKLFRSSIATSIARQAVQLPLLVELLQPSSGTSALRRAVSIKLQHAVRRASLIEIYSFGGSPNFGARALQLLLLLQSFYPSSASFTVRRAFSVELCNFCCGSSSFSQACFGLASFSLASLPRYHDSFSAHSLISRLFRAAHTVNYHGCLIRRRGQDQVQHTAKVEAQTSPA